MRVLVNLKNGSVALAKSKDKKIIVTKNDGTTTEKEITHGVELELQNIVTDALGLLPPEDYMGLDGFFDYKKGIKQLNEILSKPIPDGTKDKYEGIRKLISKRGNKIMGVRDVATPYSVIHDEDDDDDSIKVKFGTYLLELKLENSKDTYETISVKDVKTNKEIAVNKIISCIANCFTK